MANIKILQPEIYNLISAGEVIESPVGAIKELVENSIDAGATRINIEATNGGFDCLSVSDNGSGMREDDVELAFLKHATSKLSSAEDLSAIQTLGFRGEALSSIAAVSRVKLTTKHKSSDAAVCVTLENGVITNRQFVSSNVGTSIEVRDLFYNTPARKKFFRTPKREGSEISKFVSKLILTNPNLEISLSIDGKQIYQTKGGGLNEAIFAVYGEECISNCLPISYSRNNCRVNGYIGTPEYSKPNRLQQTLSVNGRFINDARICSAISQAYVPYFMTRKFAFFVLDIEVPYDDVDVNVHPKKAEVHFSDYRTVCSACYNATNQALENYAQHRAESLAEFARPLEEELSEQLKRHEENAARLTEIIDSGKYEIMNDAQASDVREIEAETLRLERDREFLEFAQQMERELTVDKVREKMGIVVDDNKGVAQKNVRESVSLTHSAMPPLVEEEKDVYDDLYARTRILGAAFRTYLILEIEDKIILVDQHAAHERIIYDKFMQAKTQDMQPVMFPYVFNVKDDEADFIEDNLDNIRSAGIEIEPFGLNTYRITAVSSVLADVKMHEFVEYLLSSVGEFKLDDRTLIVDKIAQKACKAAVKGGDCLNEYEIKYILKEVYENGVTQCPHGRPVTVVYTKRQIEKMFKRIV